MSVGQKSISIKDLQIGERIMEDIYNNDILILNRGTIVNETVKNKLKRWEIKKVKVAVDDEENSVIYNYSELFTVANHQKNRNFHIKYRQKKAKRELFYDSLTKAYCESRYGKALYEEETIAWLEEMFISILSEKNTIYIELLALKNWDEYTYIHSFDVFVLSSLIAKALRLHNIKTFALGCLLHDIGKIDVTKEILTKKGKLTDHEFEVVKTHTLLGANWLKKQNIPDGLIGDLAKLHHERLDGSGYPTGIKAENLSEYIKILMIVDIYSAITLDKIYQDKKTANVALKILLYYAETQRIEKKYVIRLMDLMSVYPVDSIVILTNKQICKVKRVLPNKPYLPSVINLKTLEVHTLPTDLSLTIATFLKYEPNDIFDDISLKGTLLESDS